MNQNIKKILLTILLMFTAITIVNAQEQTVTTPLPKKAKQKTIKYTDYQYASIGYVLNDKFVEGQKITFFNTKSETSKIDLPYLDMFTIKNTKLTDTIISGNYFIKNSMPYIEGTLYLGNDGSLTRGLFKVTNYEKKELVPISTNESKLNIEISDIYYYQIGILILKKLPDNTFSINIKYNDLTLETTIPSLSFQEFNSNEMEYLKSEIIKSKQVKLSYNNGDVFIGYVIHRNDLPAYSKYELGDYAPKSGEYRYAKGEVCNGDFGFSNIFNSIHLDKGTTLFTDGSIEKDYWIGKYHLSLDEEEKIHRESNSLTEMLIMAKSIKGVEDKKLEESKIVTNQAKKETLLKQQARKKNLIVKYGDYYGNQISLGHLVIGMTKAIVNEVWKKEYFNISTAIRNNQIIEVWEFNKEKMQLAIINEDTKNKGKEGGDAALAAVLMMNLYEEQFGEITFPKTLVFINNKLTDIYN